MTRLECSVLRCIAIVSIMLHNFAHWLPNAARENEFSFSSENNYYFWSSIFGKDFFIQFFSYWGHLGVPVFVFLTGYGLAQKYDKKENIEWKIFLYDHWKKLFIPLVVGTLVYIVVMFILEGHSVCSFNRVLAQCSMLLNFISPWHILPMPYWYFGMTMQLYIIYLLFVYKHSLNPLLLLIVASFLILIYFSQYIVLSKLNFIGWLVPLFMGITYSRHQTKIQVERGIWLAVVLCLSLFLILLFGTNYYLWLLIPVFVVISAVGIMKYVPIRFQQKMKSIGEKSLYFLIVHPITRELVMPYVSVLGDYVCILLYLFVTFIIVYAFSYIQNNFIHQIHKCPRKVINNSLKYQQIEDF